MQMCLHFSMSCRAIVMAMLLIFSSTQSLLEGAWQPAQIISDPVFPGDVLAGPVLVVNPQGNAIAIWPDAEVDANSFNSSMSSAFFTRSSGWTPSQLISSLAINPQTGNFYFHGQGDPDIDMNSSNYAVATWEGEYSVEPNFPQCVFARISSNGIWPEPALDNITVLSDQSGNIFSFNSRVAVNEAGTALITWRQEDLINFIDYTAASFLPFGGSWTAPVIISDPAGEVAIGDIFNMANPQLNLRGDAVVTWIARLSAPNAAAIMASTYNSATATWTLATLEPAGVWEHLTINPRCGIDANGHAVAIWVTGSGVKAANFNGSVWESPVFIFTNTVDSIANQDQVDVVMDSQGNSIAVWTAIDTSSHKSKLFSSFLPLNGTWSAPEPIGPEDEDAFFLPFQSQEPLVIDSAGNAMVIFVNRVTGDILSAYRAADPQWAPTEVVSAGAFGEFVNIGLGSCGFAVACWFDADDQSIRAAINENAGNNLAPINPKAKLCTDSFATQKTCCNLLRWQPAPNACVVAYNVYRNGKLIGTVKADGPLKFNDCSGCCKTKYIYTVSSINALGVESEQVPIVFN